MSDAVRAGGNAAVRATGVPPGRTSDEHRRWLDERGGELLDFAEAAPRPGGGFAELDAAGAPTSGPAPLYVTARMTHAYALAALLGRSGAAAVADHGVRSLTGPFRDLRHGGWWASLGPEGPVATDKRSYEHVFVVLAAATAAMAGRPGAEALLADALDVLDHRFWDEREGLLVDVWDAAWTQCEPYRGVNANMHAVEAMLAAADAGGGEVWRRRALRITSRVVHGWGREGGWRLPEHFTADWQRADDYNCADPAHPFRPYGSTIGHWLEWSRLCLHVHAAVPDAPAWLVDDARALYAAAVGQGWAVDGADGFVYTVDWDGRPVVHDRMHWVVCEAIAAAAVLHEVTGDPAYEQDYLRWWQYADAHLIDRVGGSWWHQLDAANSPATSVWSGKPDIYHALQATLLPRLPVAGSLAAAACAASRLSPCRAVRWTAGLEASR